MQEKIFIYDSRQANEDIYEMYEILKTIKDVVLEFMNEYAQAKRDKNIIDFNDIEHFALNILVEKNEDGKYIPTEVAKEYREKFEEIAIDEYQDSNLVQEYILTTISRKNNIFMVGDIKQSIYKFRQARLELFLEKYNTYKDVGDKENPLGTRIQLFQNFRSRKNVLDITNLVFEDIMSTELGNVDYNETEFLNLGAEYEDLKENYIGNAELHIIDIAKKEEIDEVIDIKENSEIEAEFVANKIKDIIQSNYHIYDKKQKQYRKVDFKDIVILMRKTTDIAPIYERKLAMLNYPVFCDTAQNYFETIEIQTIMSLLKIIDNPYNDIPLVTVLRSPIVGITDNELVEIRNQNRQSSFYEALCESKEEKSKVRSFLELLEDLQVKQEYLKLDELLWYIYEKTGYYNFVSLMPDGNLKIANLKMLFEKAKDYEQGSFKGLYNFINFINRVSKSNSDMGAPKLIGENENVIRIMSIHKSKGLEFPVVFLCGTGKQFNMQDLRESILLHQDLGFGPKYINYERRIEYSTLAKEAIIINAKNEIISEEMRLLYVALTRSREKLIITGIDNNLQESLKEKSDMLSIYSNSKKIDKYVVSKAKSYLDWLEMITIFDSKTKDLMKIEYHDKKVYEIENTQKENKLEFKNLSKVSPEIDEILNWEYEDKELAHIEGKSSVSKITKEDVKKEIQKPRFLEEILALTKAEIGTTVHLVMQKLDFAKEYDEEKIKELLEHLNKKNIITQKQKESVNIQKILNFTKSKLFKNIKNAKLVFREEPFYINIPADEIYQNGVEKTILVQGIIDLYYIDEEDNVVLIDYKTDYVPEKNEKYLVEKYEKQLNLYKIALEKAIKKKVNKVYIYSTFLDKQIEIFL